jgi:hypothetical protein
MTRKPAEPTLVSRSRHGTKLTFPKIHDRERLGGKVCDDRFTRSSRSISRLPVECVALSVPCESIRGLFSRSIAHALHE